MDSNDIIVKFLSDPSDIDRAFKLRHEVYAEKLKWVPESEDGLEIDFYDSVGKMLGAFIESELVGVIRVIRHPMPFMLDKEFRECLGNHLPHRGRDVIELTRLAISPSLNMGLSSKIIKTLFRELYKWCVDNNIRYVYLVVEEKFIKVLNRLRYHTQPVADAVTLNPANVLSIAGLVDISKCSPR